MPGAFQTSGGWIEVIAGVMFSGKTEELMRRVRRSTIARKRVQVFKSHLDDRYAGLLAVSSHDRRSLDPFVPPRRPLTAASRARSAGLSARRFASGVAVGKRRPELRNPHHTSV